MCALDQESTTGGGYYRKVQAAPIYEAQGIPGPRDLMIVSHLRLVVKIAKKYEGYKMPFADLVSEGTLGLIEAVDRFDAGKGYTLATYAMMWIKSAISAYILRNRSLVRMGTTVAQKKLFYNLSRLSELSDAEIAGRLKVPEREVKVMRMRMAAADYSIHTPLKDEGGAEFCDTIADPSDDQEKLLIEKTSADRRLNSLKKALRTLNERERQIIAFRKLSEQPLSLDEISQKLSISSERVRQIEKDSLKKLRRMMADCDDAMP